MTKRTTAARTVATRRHWRIDAGGDAPPHAWMQCGCVRGRRSTDGAVCACACHGLGGMIIGGRARPIAASAGVRRLAARL